MEIKNEIKGEILIYLTYALKFYESYGMWAILKMNEYKIKMEQYGPKNFTKVACESIVLSDYIIDSFKYF